MDEHTIRVMLKLESFASKKRASAIRCVWTSGRAYRQLADFHRRAVSRYRQRTRRRPPVLGAQDVVHFAELHGLNSRKRNWWRGWFASTC